LSSGRRTYWRGQDCTPIRGQSSASIDILVGECIIGEAGEANALAAGMC
jgi:hypothetical protein